MKTSDLKKNILFLKLIQKKNSFNFYQKNLKTSDIENLGAEFYGRINHGKKSEYLLNSDTVIGKYENFIGHFLHGLKLKSYEFKKYKTKKETRLFLLMY